LSKILLRLTVFELSWYSPKKQIRYVLSIGHGSPWHGQLALISVQKLYMDACETVNGEIVFSF